MQWRRRTLGWKNWPNLVMCKTDKFILRETFRSVVFHRDGTPPVRYVLCVMLPAVIIASRWRRRTIEREKEHTKRANSMRGCARQVPEKVNWIWKVAKRPKTDIHYFPASLCMHFPRLMRTYFNVECCFMTFGKCLFVHEEKKVVRKQHGLFVFSVQFNGFAVFALHSHFCLFIIIFFFVGFSLFHFVVPIPLRRQL